MEIGDFDDSLQVRAPNVMANMSETRVMGYIQRTPEKLDAFCEGALVRVYPKGTRVGSSNPDPIPFWRHGCQIVALNIQHFGIECFVNYAKFSDNNNAGYVLKRRKTDERVQRRVKVRVLGG